MFTHEVNETLQLYNHGQDKCREVLVEQYYQLVW